MAKQLLSAVNRGQASRIFVFDTRLLMASPSSMLPDFYIIDFLMSFLKWKVYTQITVSSSTFQTEMAFG